MADVFRTPDERFEGLREDLGEEIAGRIVEFSGAGSR
jgi:hypothetical protein